MPFFDLLKGQSPETKYLTRAYGRHIVSGHPVKCRVTGASPTHVIDIQQALGQGPWDALETVYFRGLRLESTAYKFRPGIRPGSPTDTIQGVSSIFTTDVAHNGAATLEATLPAGVGDADAKNSPPVGLTAIARTTKVDNYDDTGTADGIPAYSPNPARIVADLLLGAGIPISRIDWDAWTIWRDFCDELILCDYTVIPGLRGFGLTAEFYTGTNFGALVETRVEPYVEFSNSSGGPSVAAGLDNFSGKFKGKMRAKYTGTHSFYLTHDDGARLYVGDLSTPIIDQWHDVTATETQSSTISLTAGQLYDIEVHWYDNAGAAELRLEWEHTSIPRAVVPDDVLYPKAAYKPRYEAHPFWSQPTRLDDAVLQVLAICNSTYQEADGKLKFFAYDQLTAPSFSLNPDNIVDGSVKYSPRDPTTLRNFFTAKLKDLESRYLEEPLVPITYEIPELVELAGRRIEGDTLEFFNSTRWQVYRVLKAVADRSSKAKFTLELTGLPDTYPVLAGDRVQVTVDHLGLSAVDCLVTSSYDSSPEQTADERRFNLKEWI